MRRQDPPPLPQTPREHCAHCGSLNRQRAGQPRALACAGCGHQLRSCVDFGSLTDAFVWLYLLDTVGVTAAPHGVAPPVRFADALALLPAIRAAYAPADELGHDFFKLQCYFVTHFLYVASDWGAQALPRHLFLEEATFLLRQLPTVLRLNDPELVGEFVQCLRLLGVAALPRGNDLLAAGAAFLVAGEAARGREGRWVGVGDNLYNRYHSAYVGAVALLPAVYGPPPPPRGLDAPPPTAALPSALPHLPLAVAASGGLDAGRAGAAM